MIICVSTACMQLYDLHPEITRDSKVKIKKDDLPSISELHNRAFPESTTLFLFQVELYLTPIEERMTVPACL